MRRGVFCCQMEWSDNTNTVYVEKGIEYQLIHNCSTRLWSHFLTAKTSFCFFLLTDSSSLHVKNTISELLYLWIFFNKRVHFFFPSLSHLWPVARILWFVYITKSDWSRRHLFIVILAKPYPSRLFCYFDSLYICVYILNFNKKKCYLLKKVKKIFLCIKNTF